MRYSYIVVILFKEIQPMNSYQTRHAWEVKMTDKICSLIIELMIDD